MFVYSSKIIRFIADIKQAIQRILTTEVRLRCKDDRFFDRKQTASYPINVVIYNNKSMLGYFDPNFYELGFHECLIHTSQEQLHNIIRHELAHYIAFINHGALIQPHASEFKIICLRMGWGENVSKATITLDLAQNDAASESNVLRKVKKLMALTTSSHIHEAEQAMIKSQQLLLKHNLDAKNIDTENEEQICMLRVLQEKKETAKMRAIGEILKTFFVSIVYHRGKQFTTLEIVGNAVNIEIAQYVATILQSEMDNLWNRAKKQAHLKGMLAKNSFFLGLAKGYCNKIEALKKEHSQDITRALIALEKQLIDARDKVYSKLSSRITKRSYCSTSGELGEKMGKQLNINPAISKKSSDSKKLIS